MSVRTEEKKPVSVRSKEMTFRPLGLGAHSWLTGQFVWLNDRPLPLPLFLMYQRIRNDLAR